MEATGPGVCHVGLDRAEAQVLHKGFRALTAGFETKGNNTAGATRQVFLGKGIVGVILKAAVPYPSYLLMVVEEPGNLIGILSVLLHSKGQAFQT